MDDQDEPVMVFLRIRPEGIKVPNNPDLNGKSISSWSSSGTGFSQSNESKCITVLDDKSILLVAPEGVNPSRKSVAAIDDKTYNFDRVFTDYSSQEDIYEYVSPLVRATVRGYNACVFAYGCTGSGKSYSMTGNKSAPGIIPRAISEIFSVIEDTAKQDKDIFFYVRISYVELYNDKFRNLLEFASKEFIAKDGDKSYLDSENSVFDNATKVSQSGEYKFSSLSQPNNPMPHIQSNKIEVRESQSAGVFLSGPYLRIPVTTANDAFQLIAKGNKYRATAATQCNDESSRSHAILTIHVESRTSSLKSIDFSSTLGSSQSMSINVTNNNAELRLGKIHLVDLAGSERVGLSGAEGATLVETQHINSSLSELGNVLQALSYNSQILQKTSNPMSTKTLKPVSYRSSKLTHLLKDSLGGNSKTVMITTIRNTAEYYQQTLISLMYATRAKKVRNRSLVNRNIIGDTGIHAITSEIERLKNSIQERALEFESLKTMQLRDARENNVLKKRLEEMSRLNDEEKKKLESQLSNVIHSQAGELQQQREKIMSLQFSLQDELKLSQSRILEQETVIQQLQSKLNDVDTDKIHNLNLQIKQLQRDNEILEQNHKHVSQELIANLKEIKSLKLMNSDMKNDFSSIYNEKTNLINENHQLMEELKNLKNKSHEQQEEYAKKLIFLEKDRNAVKDRLSKEIASLEVKASSTIDDVHRKLREVSEVNRTYEGELMELRHKYQQDTSKLQSAIDSLQLTHERNFRSYDDEYSKRLEELRAGVEQERHEWKLTESKYLAQISKIEKSQSEYSIHETEMQKLKQQVEELMSLQDASSRRELELKQQISQYEIKLSQVSVLEEQLALKDQQWQSSIDDQILYYRNELVARDQQIVSMQHDISSQWSIKVQDLQNQLASKDRIQQEISTQWLSSVKELGDEIASMSKQLVEKENELSSHWTERVASLQSDLSMKEGDISKLKMIISDLTSQVTNLEGQMLTKEQKLSEEYQQSVKTLENQIKTKDQMLQLRLSDKEVELQSQFDRKEKEHLSKLSIARDVINNLKIQLDNESVANSKEMNELKMSIKNYETEISTMKDEILNVNHKYNSMDSYYQDLVSKFNQQLELQANDFDTILVNRLNEIEDNTKTQLESLHHQYKVSLKAEYLEKISSLETQLESQRVELENGRQQINQLKKLSLERENSIKLEVNDRDLQLVSYSTNLQNLQLQLDQNRSELYHKEIMFKELESQMMMKITELNTTIDSKESQLKEQLFICEDLKEQIRLKSNEYSSLLKEKDIQMNESSRRNDDLESQLLLLKEKLDCSLIDATSHQKELTHQLSLKEDALEVSQTKTSSLENQLRLQLAQISELQSQYTIAKKQHEVNLQDELSKQQEMLKRQYQDEINKLNKNHIDAISEIASKSQEEYKSHLQHVIQLQSEKLEDEIRNLKDLLGQKDLEHSNYILEIKGKHESLIHTLQSKHSQQFNELKESYEKLLQQVRYEYESGDHNKTKTIIQELSSTQQMQDQKIADLIMEISQWKTKHTFIVDESREKEISYQQKISSLEDELHRKMQEYHQHINELQDKYSKDYHDIHRKSHQDLESIDSKYQQILVDKQKQDMLHYQEILLKEKQYHEKLNMIEESHRKQLSSLQEEYQSKSSERFHEFEAKLRSLNQLHSDEVTELHDTIHELSTKHTAELCKLKDQHDEFLKQQLSHVSKLRDKDLEDLEANLKRKHDNKVLMLQQSYDLQISNLQAVINSYESKHQIESHELEVTKDKLLTSHASEVEEMKIQHNELVQHMIREHDVNMSRLREELNQKENVVVLLNHSVAELTDKFTSDIRRLQQEHAVTLASMSLDTEKMIDEQITQHNETIETLKNKYQVTLETMKMKHENEVEAISSKLISTHERKMQSIQDQFTKEKELLMHDYEMLKSQVVDLQSSKDLLLSANKDLELERDELKEDLDQLVKSTKIIKDSVLDDINNEVRRRLDAEHEKMKTNYEEEKQSYESELSTIKFELENTRERLSCENADLKVTLSNKEKEYLDRITSLEAKQREDMKQWIVMQENEMHKGYLQVLQSQVQSIMNMIENQNPNVTVAHIEDMQAKFIATIQNIPAMWNSSSNVKQQSEQQSVRNSLQFLTDETHMNTSIYVPPKAVPSIQSTIKKSAYPSPPSQKQTVSTSSVVLGLNKAPQTDQLIAAILDADYHGIKAVVKLKGEDLNSFYWRDIVKSILPMHRAVAGLHFHGNDSKLLKTLQVLYQLGTDINLTDAAGNTVLHKAIQICTSTGAIAIVENLLKNGADPKKRNKQGEVPLHTEIKRLRSASVRIIEELLKHNADINCLYKYIDGNVVSPLTMVLKEGCRCVTTLYSSSRQTSSPSSNDPLYVEDKARNATQRVWLKVAEQLISSGAKWEPDWRSTNNSTQLHLLLSTFPPLVDDTTAFINLLQDALKNHVDPNVEDDMGRNVLFVLCEAMAKVSIHLFPRCIDIMQIVISCPSLRGIGRADKTGRTIFDIVETTPNSCFQECKTLVKIKMNDRSRIQQ